MVGILPAKLAEDRQELEFRRKLLHSLIGLFLLALLFFSGRDALLQFLGILLFAGSLMIVWMKDGRKIPVADWFEETFERDAVKFPGYGAFWYVLGSFIFVLLIPDAPKIAAMLIALALGDSASTIIGIKGSHHLPYNRRKTLEGSVAFFVFSLPVCLILGTESGLLFALLMTIVESLPVPLDDNLMIPLASMLFFGANRLF
ncbi:Uncharacterised protein [uncultured archaeon]|nr:Uncharacterised protein [uncultured archaeon]